MSNIIDINGNAVNPPEMPEARPSTPAEIEQSSLQLQAFADGYIFKFTHHETEPDKFILFDCKNNPIGVIRNAPIAQLICDALRAMFAAVALMKGEQSDAAADQQLAASLAQDEANERADELTGHNPPVMES